MLKLASGKRDKPNTQGKIRPQDVFIELLWEIVIDV
jgi:hypothetical protein